MKAILSLIISGALVVSSFGQTRNVLVGTNNTVVQPTNFWSADASNARVGLGLGSAATNSASAFQPSSSTLSNLAVGNGINLTNVTATIVGTNVSITNVSGLQTELNTKLATNGSAAGLTNFPTLNQNTTGTASNVTGVVAIANGGTGATNASSARSSLGGTTVGANLFTLVNPDDVRFLRLNANNTVSALTAADFRTAISVGTNVGTVTSIGMTVPAIFSLSTATIISNGTFGLTLTNQSSRQAFLAPNGGGTPAFRGIESDDLPSLAISKITGLQTALDGKLATSGTATLATNVTGIVALANGGTGGTNAESGRTGLGATTIGANIFTLLNPSAVRFLRLNADNTASALSDSDFRTALSLNTAATNPSSAFQPSSSALTNLSTNNGVNLTNIPLAGVVGALATNGSAAGLTNFPASLLTTNGNGAGLTNLTGANITGTVALASNVTGTIAISNGGSGAATAGGARTNLGLGATNAVSFLSITLNDLEINTTNAKWGGIDRIEWETRLLQGGDWTINGGPLVIGGGTNSLLYQAQTRTNLGLVWSALTNTTASGFQASLFGTGTNPVLVDTNGEVVSPTNFWQAAPINTVLQNITNVVGNSTNAATNARMLFLYSLAPTVTNVTSTITLPTNGSTFGGDVATITHLGPTSSVTAIRALGSSTNLITLNQSEESVRFIYRDSQWKLMDNISYIESIFFSGTNASANAAASRTNLGLGTTNAVNFARLELTDTTTNANLWIADQGEIEGDGDLFIGAGAIIFTSPIEFNNATNAATTRTNLGLGATDNVSIGSDGGSLTTDDFNAATINVSGAISFTNAATTRTNLGLPLAALTNTNNAGFQRAIFQTNTTPTNGANLGDAKAWIEISVVTNSVTNSYRIPVFQ